MTVTIIDNTTFCFYTILQKERVTHLSFDHEKHLNALSYLKKTFPTQDVRALLEKIPEKDLKKFLGGQVNQLPSCGSDPFVTRGTPFQRRVWRLISTIPYGETRTYSDLARALGNPSLARAVGRACNTNPLALFIPCHRVTAKNGPGGFAGGCEIKRRLLDLEATS